MQWVFAFGNDHVRESYVSRPIPDRQRFAIPGAFVSRRVRFGFGFRKRQRLVTPRRVDLAMECNVNDAAFVNGATATILAEFM